MTRLLDSMQFTRANAEWEARGFIGQPESTPPIPSRRDAAYEKLK
jgi:hypothetical protein